jgi:hypothetical protein
MTNTETADPIPTSGMDATLVLWTDRHAYRVSRVGPSGKVLWAKRLKATRTDKNGMSESQTYTYADDPEATEDRFQLCGDGLWKGPRGRLSLGHAREYHDFSF